MANTVKVKRSGTASATPSALEHGELAINYADDTLFWKDSSNVIQSFVFQAYASATHASSHATGGSDALTPSDIGAAPLANATLTTPILSGNVDLRNGGAGDYAIDVVSTATTGTAVLRAAQSGLGNNGFTITTDGSHHVYAFANSGGSLVYTSTARLGVGTVTPASRLDVNGVITVSAGSAAAPAIVASGDSNTGIAFATDTLIFSTAGAERVRIDANGNATFTASSGVPLTVTNTGTGNSFVVEDATSDTTPFVVDADGRLGIGGTPSQFSTSFNQLIIGSGSANQGATIYSTTQGTLAFGDTATTGADAFRGYVAYVHTTDYMVLGTGGAERLRINSAGITVNGVITVSAGSAAAPALVSGTGTSDSGLFWPAADTVAISTAGTERFRIDANGNATFTASSGVPLTVTNTGTGNSFVVNDAAGDTTPFVVDAAGNVLIGSGSAVGYTDYASMTLRNVNGGVITLLNGSGTAYGELAVTPTATYFKTATSQPIWFGTSNAERMRLTAVGDLGLGPSRTAPASRLDVNGDVTITDKIIHSGDTDTAIRFPENDAVAVETGGSERLRVKSTGAIRFVPLAADPATGETGDVYYNSANNKLRVYNGTSWVDLH